MSTNVLRISQLARRKLHEDLPKCVQIWTSSKKISPFCGVCSVSLSLFSLIPDSILSSSLPVPLSSLSESELSENN